jgi:hypothetical protein
LDAEPNGGSPTKSDRPSVAIPADLRSAEEEVHAHGNHEQHREDLPEHLAVLRCVEHRPIMPARLWLRIPPNAGYVTVSMAA